MSATTFDCNEIEELLPEYVLGTLDADEVAEIARHLGDCPKHVSSLHSYQDVCDAMSLGVPQIDPPARLKTRLMASIVSPPRTITRTRPTLRLSWALAAVAMGVALLLGVWGLSLQSQVVDLTDARQKFSAFVEQTQTRMVALNTMPEGGAAKAVLFINDSRAAVWALGLPELALGEVYQCWWFNAQHERVSGGSFTTRAGATVWYLDLPYEGNEFHTIVIAREPHGESVEPEGPGVLSGDF